MSKRKRNPDMRLVNLCVPMSSLPTQQLADGSLRTFDTVKGALRRALSRCCLSREIVAEELTRLTGHEVSIHQINNWAAPGKEDRPVPLHFLAAIIVITEDTELAQAALAGPAAAVSPDESVFFEIGMAEVAKREEAKKRKELWEQIGK